MQWFFWQNVRALAEMSRHDFIWPEGLPGGIKGLVKRALKQAQEQLEVAEERAESRAAMAKQSAPFSYALLIKPA